MLDQFSQLWDRSGLKRAGAVSVALVAVLAVVVSAGGGGGVSDRSLISRASADDDGGRSVELLAARKPRGAGRAKKHCLRKEHVREARHFAEIRSGSIGFAVYDECGRVVGVHRNRVFSSASVVKVMLLTAYLRRGDVSRRDLTGEEKATLGAMITVSDNKAADEVFAAVGEAGLNEVADAADMANFVPSSSWGGSGITAADQAAFLGRLERFVPKRHEGYAAKLTRSVIPDQTWGVADVKPEGWTIGFKGGWYMAPDGWRVNQVARLTLEKKGRDRSFALAVLTDQNASFQYGRETIAGIAKRLMEGYRR